MVYSFHSFKKNDLICSLSLLIAESSLSILLIWLKKSSIQKAILLENDDIQLYYIEPLWVVDFNKTCFKFNI